MLDNMQSDLQINLFPTVEQAFRHVCREVVRQLVMNTNDSSHTLRAGLASVALKHKPNKPSMVKSHTPASTPSYDVRIQTQNHPPTRPSHIWSQDPTNNIKCTHYGRLDIPRNSVSRSRGIPTGGKIIKIMYGPMGRPPPLVHVTLRLLRKTSQPQN